MVKTIGMVGFGVQAHNIAAVLADSDAEKLEGFTLRVYSPFDTKEQIEKEFQKVR